MIRGNAVAIRLIVCACYSRGELPSAESSAVSVVSRTLIMTDHLFFFSCDMVVKKLNVKGR